MLGWHLVRKVLHEYLVFLKVWPQYSNCKLIVARYTYKVHLTQLEKLLVFDQHQLEKVFVHHTSWWQVELN